jgi:hypothetical protein
MIFPTQWSQDIILTGNSQFVIDASEVIWIVSNTGDDPAILKSVDHGVTFTTEATITGLTESTIAFDPALAIDSSGTLHILGQQNTGLNVEVIKYTYVPSSNALTGPYSVTQAGLIASDYDIVPLTNGNCFIATALVTTTADTFYGIEMEPSGTIAHTDVISTTTELGGNRIGTVSLITPDGVNVEIYYGSHLKRVTFQDFAISILGIGRSAPSTYTSPTTITQFQARHVDDRLTVIADGSDRYLSQCYYTQVGLNLTGNVILGHLPNGSTWSFAKLLGTPTASLVEPVFSISTIGVILAYIVMDLTRSPRVDGTIALFSVNTAIWEFTPRIDFHGIHEASYIRGSKSLFPIDSLWGLLAQTQNGTATYYTGFNSPPTAILLPGTLTANRGTVYQLSAANSTDPNQDTLGFSWSMADPSSQAVLTPNGDMATFYIPKTVGPAEVSITVTVAVTDYDSNGNAIHSPVTASSAITVPFVAPPTIGDLATINAGRNSSVTLAPSIIYAPGTLLIASWTQVQGTPLPLVGGTSSVSLTFSTNGANVAGETILWELTVSDGVNQPVSKTFTINIAASVALGTSVTFRDRSVWSGTISQRNTSIPWPSPQLSSVRATFHSLRRTYLLNGVNVECCVGPNLITIYGTTPDRLTSYLRHIVLPNPMDTVVDAVHTEANYTIVLTSRGELQQYLSNKPNLSTDDPDVSLSLSDITALVFNRIFFLPNVGNTRILVLAGSEGALLLQVDNTTFAIEKYIELTETDGLVYGAANIQWVRSYGVESLAAGQFLLGSKDSEGNTFETLTDIGTRQVIQTWNASTLRNQFVYTGEILSKPASSYAGKPTSPTLNIPVQVDSSYILTWQQNREDLVTGYVLQYSIDGGYPRLLTTVPSGTTLEVVVLLPVGHVYQVQVAAVSLDGTSAWSNAEVIEAVPDPSDVNQSLALVYLEYGTNANEVLQALSLLANQAYGLAMPAHFQGLPGDSQLTTTLLSRGVPLDV